MQTTIKIISGSPLSNRTVQEVAKEFSIIIVATYDQNYERLGLLPNQKIIPPVYLEINGDFENVRRFSLTAVDFKGKNKEERLK